MVLGRLLGGGKRGRRWSRERVLEELRRWRERRGRPPSVKEVPNSLRCAAARYFGSWVEAKRRAGLGSLRPKWSRGRVLEELREWGRRLGRAPTAGEVPPSLLFAAIRNFGSWAEAKRRAGLEVYRPGRPPKAGEA